MSKGRSYLRPFRRWCKEVMAVFTFKNVAALGLFLFGSTFLWMTRDFLANPREGAGVLWTLIQVLVLTVIIGFTIAAWLVFTEASWEPVALASAAVGLAALVAYVIGVQRAGDGGDAGVRMNIALHACGIAAVFIATLMPTVHGWVTRKI